MLILQVVALLLCLTAAAAMLGGPFTQ